jgi:hypothetical protein
MSVKVFLDSRSQKPLTLAGKERNMTPMIPVVIMSINYSHDIATALLAVSGAFLWMLSSLYPPEATISMERSFVAPPCITKRNCPI